MGKDIFQYPSNSRHKTTLSIGEGPGLPLWVVTGSRPGPTLVISAGVHGCEYVGVQTLRKLFERLDPAAMSGRMLLLPVVNVEGFFAGSKRVVPSDGKNINRVFPQASKTGSVSERIAWAIRSHIYPLADFLLDLHSGDCNEALTPLVFFPATASPEVVEQARKAASCLDVDFRVPSSADNGLYSCAAHSGIPAMLLEIGGLGLWTEEEVERGLRSIKNLMAFLGIQGEGRPNAAQREAVESVYVEASAAGFWYPRVQAGAAVRAGDQLGVLEDWDGAPLQTVEARFDGLIWYHCVSLGVAEGDSLVAYGRCASPGDRESSRP